MSDDSVVIPEEEPPVRLPEVPYDEDLMNQVYASLDAYGEADATLELVASALAGNAVPSWSKNTYDSATRTLRAWLRYPDEGVPSLVTALLAWRRSQ